MDSRGEIGRCKGFPFCGSDADCEHGLQRWCICYCASPQDTKELLHDTWELRCPCCLVRVYRQVRTCLYTPTWKESIWRGLTVQPQRIADVTPRDQSRRNPVIENVKSIDLLRSRKVAYPWTGEPHFWVAPGAQSKSVLRTSVRILVPMNQNDVNPMAIADSGACQVISPTTALYDDKSAKQVSLRFDSLQVR